MKGPNAVERMRAALEAVDPRRTKLVIIARGGGDRVDLAAFDDARLLRAVKQCPAPTLVAIGHVRDEPLIEKVATWVLNTPTDVRKPLYPAVTGKPTMEEQRANRAIHDHELARACAEVERLNRVVTASQAQAVHLTRERERDVDIFARHWWDLVREENARRIRQHYRLLALLLTFASPLMAWLWWRAAAPEWQATWLHPLVMLVVVWAAAAIVGLTPRRLGRRPWLRTASRAELAKAYRSAKTVGAFNRAAAAHDEVTPRLRRPRSHQT